MDGKLATLVPRIAEHFAKAESEASNYGELDDAIAGADGVPEPARSVQSNRGALHHASAENDDEACPAI